MSALIAEIRQGKVNPETPVVFIHSGGLPQTFAFADQLWNHKPNLGFQQTKGAHRRGAPLVVALPALRCQPYSLLLFEGELKGVAARRRGMPNPETRQLNAPISLPLDAQGGIKRGLEP